MRTRNIVTSTRRNASLSKLPEQRHRHAAPLFAVLVLFGALLTACGSSTTTAAPATTSGSASASGSGSVTITIKNFAFHPAAVTVTPGAKITVINMDTATHTLTAMPGSTPLGGFNTGDLSQSRTKVVTAPTSAGKYQYYCMIHNYMTGTITVS